ncbi:RNA 2',3'-cyclic phosphodiesterase [Metabacillus sp. FJAT-52054]|uniref:RNA 2',3'-cyclic phosphodiesterase n=1 Tax=Metabacillus sediminis TaxID=3117746 RepID=A0ABZ2NDX4_9BACI
MGTHYFLAVRIPRQQSAIIQSLIKQECSRMPFKRWVHPFDYHITLAFLGEPPSGEHLLQLSDDLSEIIEGRLPSFHLDFAGIQTFGAADSPRILWLGVRPSKTLMELREEVYSCCIKNGFQLDPRPFKPHITLARKWDGKDPYLNPDGWNPESIPSFEVPAIDLLQTNVNEEPKYKTIRSFPLTGADS